MEDVLGADNTGRLRVANSGDHEGKLKLKIGLTKEKTVPVKVATYQIDE